MRRVHRRQVSTLPAAPSGSSLSGAATIATTGVPTNSLLVTTGGPAGEALPTSDVVTFASPTSSTTLQTAEPSTSAAKTSASSSSISIGTVVGICFGVFISLAVVLLIVFYIGRRRKSALQKRPYAKQRDVNGDTERCKSGREVWVKMDDKNEKPDAYAMKRTTQVSVAPSSTVVPQSPTTIERSITVKSSKSSKTFKSVGYGTGLGFTHTFKTPEVPPQLEFTDSSIGDGFMHPFARSHVPVSWDSRTVAEGDSYLSLKRESDAVHFGLDSPVSSVVVSHPTPPAVETNMHQWEKAEVVSPGVSSSQDAYGGIVADDKNSGYSHSSQSTIRKPLSSRNPFAHIVENPFQDPSSQPVYQFSANDAPPTASSSTSYFPPEPELTPRTQEFSNLQHEAEHQHERNDSNDHAMASLIAALDITPEQAQERLSAAHLPTPRASASSALSIGMHSLGSKISEVSEADTIDEERYRRFPLPPDRLSP